MCVCSCDVSISFFSIRLFWDWLGIVAQNVPFIQILPTIDPLSLSHSTNFTNSQLLTIFFWAYPVLFLFFSGINFYFAVPCCRLSWLLPDLDCTLISSLSWVGHKTLITLYCRPLPKRLIFKMALYVSNETRLTDLRMTNGSQPFHHMLPSVPFRACLN